MIWTTRTVTCDFCGEWRPIDDGETARAARKRLRAAGWRGLPHANQRGRLMDACPKHPAFPSGAVACGPDDINEDPAAQEAGAVGGHDGAGQEER